MCVKFVCVKLLYVKFVCVVLRRRREEEEKPGIQNQKQEPHTKMWGKTTFEPLLIAVEHCRTAALRVALKVDPDRKSLEEILQKMVSVNSFDLQH